MAGGLTGRSPPPGSGGADERTDLDGPAGAAPLARVFGDGAHPTTRLAATRLAAALRTRRGPRVLDAGTGTGVLAARALAHGADVVALDRDPEAVRAARVRAPGARIVARDVTGGVADLGAFDIVVANLPLPALDRALPALAAVTAPGGQLIATGIPLVFARRVERTLAGAGLEVGARRALSGWCALVAAPPPGRSACQ